MKQILSLIICMFVVMGMQAQNTRYSSYNWEMFPVIPVSDTVKSTKGALILMEREIKEVFANAQGTFEEIQVFHRTILVENATAISQHNRIYVPTDGALEIISIRARFISPGGKITEVPKSNIRQTENLENKGDYSIFAIEGAEAGGQIDYFYVLRKSFDAFGTMVKQDDRTRNNVDVIFSYPSKLEYMIKSYNGFPKFVKTTDSAAGITEQRAMAGYIPGVEEEKYSNYTANLQRYEYTLTYNRYNSSVRAYSWAKVGSRVYDVYFQAEKKEIKAVREWLEDNNISFEKRDAAIRQVEDLLKTTISVVPGNEVRADASLDQVLKSKQAAKRNIIRLFCNIFRESGVKFNLVCTTDITKHPFDPDFNGWNYLDETLLYFPESGKYLVPDEETHRYGQAPEIYQENYGIFFKPVPISEEPPAMGYEIRSIALGPFEMTDSLSIMLRPDPVKLEMNAEVRRVFLGDFASSFQAFWHLSDEERQKEMVKTVFDMGDPDVRIQSFTVKNNQPTDIGIRPFIWNVKCVSPAMIGSAGEDLLIRIGESIGQQTEMYQGGERRFPISVIPRHGYYRKIELVVPEGYHPGDISSLNMNVTLSYNGREGCYFRSGAKIEGNKVIVVSEELYPDSKYPKECIEDFRKVINAAADFNKKTLLLVRNP